NRDEPSHSSLQQHLANRYTRSANTVHDNTDVLDPFINDLKRIEQTGNYNNRCPVLIIMKHRNVQLIRQPALNFEAARRADILQVDAAKNRTHRLDRSNNFLRILRIKADGKSIDACQLLEQHRFPFHDRSCSMRPNVAKPRTAVPSVTTAIVLRLIVSEY